MPWTSNVRIPEQLSKNAPALATFAGGLHLVHAGDSSNDIWHSVSTDGATWSGNVRLPDQKSKGPSAIAEFGGRLHIVHQGDSSNQLWHASFDGNRWTANARIDGESAQSPPALATFGGLLHCLHNGNSSTKLYHLTFDGIRWTKRGADPGLDGQRSKGAVALAVFGGLLHMVHQGESSNRLWHSTFDGTRWTENVPIPNQLSKSPPALAAFGDLLHLVHLGDSSNSLWHSTFDGSAWAPNIAIPYQLSKAAAALAAFDGRLHMVHLGDSSNALWHSTSDGVLIRRPSRRVVVLDLDGLRWDTFYAHLKRTVEAGASTTASYRFDLPQGASKNTVLGSGNKQLNSAFAELCLADGNGMLDVRLPLTTYPSFTFPTHASMYTGARPGRHGVTGHTFMVRDVPPEWDRHSWDTLPRALSLQGYCTSETGSFGAFLDYLWGGFDEVSASGCTNRNRGLVSDLRVPTVFELAHRAGLRTCSINSFYHGAQRPWEQEGHDQWWHYDRAELRSVKDVCSDEDLDQLEYADHSAWTKASLLLSYRPSTLAFISPSALPGPVGGTAKKLSGEPNPGWRIVGSPHPDGIPDLIAIYCASIDESSHKDGPRNQATYLAWMDHRLARFVRDLKAADPDAWDNTVFAVIADHGHAPVAQAPDTEGLPESNEQVVREELLRVQLGTAEADKLMDQWRRSYPQYYSILLDASLRDQLYAYAQAMNLYVYVREPDRFDPVEVARRLLSRAMRCEPYGALVLVGGSYQFLARGDTTPVPLTDARCREAVLPQLDVPGVSAADVDAVSLTPADVTAETALRERLRTPAAFDLLRVAERVGAFQPDGNRSMPDILLLAPAGRSFTSSPSTHGSFAYPTSRIPMVFCGPGMPAGRTTVAEASLLDFTPTLLGLLGLPIPEDLPGRALAGRIGGGRPIRPGRWPVTFPGRVVSGGIRVVARQAPPRGRFTLELKDLRPATEADLRAAGSSALLVGVDLKRTQPGAVARLVRRAPMHARVAGGQQVGEYLLQGLDLHLARRPRWLAELLADLAEAPGPSLQAAEFPGLSVSAAQFVRLIGGLDQRLTRARVDPGRFADVQLQQVEPSAPGLGRILRAEVSPERPVSPRVWRPGRIPGRIPDLVGVEPVATQPAPSADLAEVNRAFAVLEDLLTRNRYEDLTIASRHCSSS